MVERSCARAASRTSACSRRWDASRASCSYRPSCASDAYADVALPIGEGQTISQPYMVARICEELELPAANACSMSARAPATRPRCSRSSPPRCTRSSGSGARRPRPSARGRVRRSRARARRRRQPRPAEHAPFGAIAVAAAAPHLPDAVRAARVRGRLVVPVGNRWGSPPGGRPDAGRPGGLRTCPAGSSRSSVSRVRALRLH